MYEAAARTPERRSDHQHGKSVSTVPVNKADLRERHVGSSQQSHGGGPALSHCIQDVDMER
jgi:hypothetical protein